MLRIKSISEVIGKKAYTSDGEFFGQVEEVSLVDNKIEGWKVKVAGSIASSLGGARGVIIPHQFVKSIGDVFIINKASLPIREESMELASADGSGLGAMAGEDIS